MSTWDRRESQDVTTLQPDQLPETVIHFELLDSIRTQETRRYQGRRSVSEFSMISFAVLDTTLPNIEICPNPFQSLFSRLREIGRNLTPGRSPVG